MVLAWICIQVIGTYQLPLGLKEALLSTKYVADVQPLMTVILSVQIFDFAGSTRPRSVLFTGEYGNWRKLTNFGCSANCDLQNETSRPLLVGYCAMPKLSDFNSQMRPVNSQ